MSNTDIELQILSMLRDGYSYADIESTLGVSSKTIAKVNVIRKATESTDSKDSRIGSFQKQENSFPFQPNLTNNGDTFPETFQPESKEHRQSFQTCMDTKMLDDTIPHPERKSAEEIKLEEIREQNKHELLIKDFEWKKEKEERELSLQQQEVNIKRQNLMDIRNERQRKIERKRKSFLLKFNDLAGQCTQGEWKYEDIDDLLSDSISLYNKSLDFCNKHSISFDGSDYEKILGEICDSLEKTIAKAKEDEEVYWDQGRILVRWLRNVHKVTL